MRDWISMLSFVRVSKQPQTYKQIIDSYHYVYLFVCKVHTHQFDYDGLEPLTPKSNREFRSLFRKVLRLSQIGRGWPYPGPYLEEKRTGWSSPLSLLFINFVVNIMISWLLSVLLWGNGMGKALIQIPSKSWFSIMRCPRVLNFIWFKVHVQIWWWGDSNWNFLQLCWRVFKSVCVDPIEDFLGVQFNFKCHGCGI